MKNIVYNVLLLGGLMVPMQNKSTDIVHWTARVSKVKNLHYEVEIKGIIADGWYFYSQKTEEAGLVPITISFEPDSLAYELVDLPVEKGDIKKRFDPQFSSPVFYVTDSVRYLQTIKRLNNKPFILRGAVAYMGCDASICLPPQLDSFSVKIR